MTEVTSVKRDGVTYCAPPVEPISGYIRPMPEAELLRMVVDCASRAHLIASPDTREALIQLTDGSKIEMDIKVSCVKSIEKVSAILGRDVSEDVILGTDDTLISAPINLKDFLALARCEDVKKVGLLSERQPEVRGSYSESLTVSSDASPYILTQYNMPLRPAS